jgi:hypothetical protein
VLPVFYSTTITSRKKRPSQRVLLSALISTRCNLISMRSIPKEFFQPFKNAFQPHEPEVKNQISVANRHVLPAMKEQLQLKAYSVSTIRTYLNEMTQLLRLLGNIPAEQLTADHLRRYLVFCYERLHLKENTLHSRINAMKFYYEQVLGR